MIAHLGYNTNAKTKESVVNKANKCGLCHWVYCYPRLYLGRLNTTQPTKAFPAFTTQNLVAGVMNLWK